MGFNYNRKMLGRCVVLCLFSWGLIGAWDQPLLADDESPQANMAAEYEATIKKMRRESKSQVAVSPVPVVTEVPPIVFRGEEGIPFPAPSEVVPLPVPTVNVGLLTATPTPKPTRTPWQLPGRCERNETTFVQSDPQGNPQKILYDLLFLDEELVPLDPSEVFGGRVSLNPYGPKSGKGGEIAQRIHRVPCVPYRVRRTDRGYYYDKGVNALKNYSEDQKGRGRFHPFIEQKLFGSSKGQRRR